MQKHLSLYIGNVDRKIMIYNTKSNDLEQRSLLKLKDELH